MDLNVRIFFKGFVRWLAISTVIIFVIFIVNYGFNIGSLIEINDALLWNIGRFILFFSLICGLADVLLYWIKCFKQKEK